MHHPQSVAILFIPVKHKTSRQQQQERGKK
jgi:hypothetical protein